MSQGKYGPRINTGLTEPARKGYLLLLVVTGGEVLFSGLGWEN